MAFDSRMGTPGSQRMMGDHAGPQDVQTLHNAAGRVAELREAFAALVAERGEDGPEVAARLAELNEAERGLGPGAKVSHGLSNVESR